MPEQIDYGRFAPEHLAGVVACARVLDWPSYADPAAALAAFTAPGSITCVATHRDTVIGLAHLLTNGVVHAHLSLVGVLPEHRRRGVARELVATAFRDAGARWLDLCSEPGSEGFYRSFPHRESVGFRIQPPEPATRRSVAAGGSAPDRSGRPSPEDARQLTQLEESLWLPETRFDAGRMRRLLAPDFLEFGRSGRVHGLEDVVSMERQEIPAKLPLPGLEVRLVAPDAALLTYESDLAWPSGRERARRSSLWTRTAEGWQLRFHQGTPIPAQD